MNYAQHPLSAAFPAMPEEDFRSLVEDIRQHGQRDLATLCDGMVIDGWHRYQACEELGIPCRFEEFSGADAVAFVRSKNQHRRHYQKSQQAAIEVALTDWAEAHRPKKGEAASPFSTNKEMAQRAGTTERTIQHAKRAHEAGLGAAVRDGKLSAERAAEMAKADPELARQVAHGEVSLPKAVQQVDGRKPERAARRDPQPEAGDSASPAEVVELKSMLAEQAGHFERTLAENIALQKIVDADDQLAEAARQVKQLTAENMRLRERINGLTNEAAEAKRLAKSWRSKAERAERAAA